MKSLLTFINESIPYKKLNGKKLNNKTIGEFIDYANERSENEEDPNEWNKFDNVLGVFSKVYFRKGYLYNGYLDVPFNFEIEEGEYTFNDAYEQILGALSIEDENL